MKYQHNGQVQETLLYLLHSWQQAQPPELICVTAAIVFRFDARVITM
jgi:hypothetical protein